MKLFIDPLAKINIFSMTHRNKKERLSEVLIRLGCESKKSTCRQNQRYLFCYLFYQYIYFIFIFNLRRLIIEEPSKFLINPLVKINIFFLWFIGTKKKDSARSWVGRVVEVKKVLTNKNKEIFFIIYFIYIFRCWKANKGVG